MKITSNFVPHRKQQEFIDAILGGKEKFITITASRQTGKSLLAMNLVLYWAINNGPCKILWVAPVYAQVSKVHKEIVEAITSSGIISNNNYSENYLELKNGSVIYFRSAERYDNIRSLTCDYGVLDEAGFMKDEAWTAAIRPVFAVKGKKVIFISTPKGKNFFYNLYQLGLSLDNPRYLSMSATCYDTPYLSIEEIDDAKKTLPESIFKQEYLAEFIDGGGSVFQNISKNYFDAYTNPVGKVFCGIDLAKQNDFTVATFIDTQGKVIHIYRANHKEWGTMVAEILVLVKKYGATVLIEVNSIGDVIYELFKKQWNDTHPFVTSNSSKQEIVEGLILDFNEGSVKIPSNELNPVLTNELEIFTYDYNPKTRSIKYGHPQGLHDDTVLSLCLGNYARKKMKSYGTYAVGLPR